MARAGIDLKSLRAAAEAIAACTTLEEAEAQIDRTVPALGMLMAAWSPDLSQPYFDAVSDAFHRRQGWPEEILDLWWNRHATLKMPFYIRCRFEHLPFVAPVELPARAGSAQLPRDQKRAASIVREIGICSLLTVPIHLPKGHVAMLTWASAQDAAIVRPRVQPATPELMALAHHFMRIYREAFGRRGVTAEELSKLTPKEWNCLRLTAQGFREAEVAAISGIAQTTVRFHLDNVVKKLGAANRTHAVAMAAQLGMLGPIGS